MVRNSFLKVFFIALIVRLLYSLASPGVFYFNADTQGYYTLGLEMFTHPSLQTVITPYRTPVYPLFLNGVMYLSGSGGTQFGSPAFLRGAQVVALVQMIFGAFAFTVFYSVLKRFLPARTRLP